MKDLSLSCGQLQRNIYTMIKLTILITFILLTISLFSGLFIVYKNKGQGKQGLYALVIRVSLAVILMLQIGWGLSTGQIGSRAPWDKFSAPNAPAIKERRFESKAPVRPDPIKDQALKEAKEEYLRSTKEKVLNKQKQKE